MIKNPLTNSTHLGANTAVAATQRKSATGAVKGKWERWTMSKDFTIVPQDYIVHHIKTDEILVITKDGDYAYHVKTERIPLVHCSECKHWSEPWSDQYDTYGEYCELSGKTAKADDFCSYGEREGEQTLQMVGKVKVEL